MRKSCVSRMTALAGLLFAATLLVSPARAADIAAAQRALVARGYEVGHVDGLLGPQTRQAIRAFQADQNVPLTGEISEGLVRLLIPPRVLSPITLPVLDANSSRQTAGALQTDTATVADTKHPDHFVDRNWLVQDQDAHGTPIGPPFSVYLEQGGGIAGPRFADHMRWQRAEADRITLTYEHSVGLKIQRDGHLTAQNRIAGRAEASDGTQWSWIAEARPNPNSGAGRVLDSSQ
jgi:hypothetical protein